MLEGRPTVEAKKSEGQTEEEWLQEQGAGRVEEEEEEAQAAEEEPAEDGDNPPQSPEEPRATQLLASSPVT